MAVTSQLPLKMTPRPFHNGHSPLEPTGGMRGRIFRICVRMPLSYVRRHEARTHANEYHPVYTIPVHGPTDLGIRCLWKCAQIYSCDFFFVNLSKQRMIGPANHWLGLALIKDSLDLMWVGLDVSIKFLNESLPIQCTFVCWTNIFSSIQFISSIGLILK